MSHVKNIAIVGAAGTMGKYLVAELLNTGKHQLTAITRTDSQSTFPSEVKVAKANYDDHSSLVTALQGQNVLIITLAAFAPPDTEEKLAKAAVEANVAYIVPNGWGVDVSRDPWYESALGIKRISADQHVQTVGKSSWIKFVSGFWYEFSLGGDIDRFGFDFNTRSVKFYEDGTARINTSTWEQIARAVARLFSLPEESDGGKGDGLTLADYKNKHVFVSSFFVSQKDMFESVLRVTGTKEEDWSISYDKPLDRFNSGIELLKTGDRLGFLQALYAREFITDESSDSAHAFEVAYGLCNDALGLPKEDMDERTDFAIKERSRLVTGEYHIRSKPAA